MNKFGYFTPQDPQLSNLRWGNWGSRPMEYAWCSKILSPTDMKIIDLGTGLPSEHNFFRHVMSHNPDLYVGIDFDSRMKNEEIHEPTCKMLYMDMTNLDFPDKFFNFCYSISTFEHIPTTEAFFKAIKETHRVLEPGSKMVVTLDELWDNNNDHHNQETKWNDLEKALIKDGVFKKRDTSFGMQDFAALVLPWFEPDGIELSEIPMKTNADNSLLHHPYWNSTVSYGVFTKT